LLTTRLSRLTMKIASAEMARVQPGRRDIVDPL
jgi:hypothetical protein